MSMNIHIIATRSVSFTKPDGSAGSEPQTENFSAIQTPTAVTLSIYSSSDPAVAYLEYVKSLSLPEKIPVYAQDDIWEEGEPVGYEDYDWTAVHAEQFTDWVSNMIARGFEIKFGVL